jgi:hypothetical protein
MALPLDDEGAASALRIGVRASVAVDAIDCICAIALADHDPKVLLDAEGALGLIQRMAETRRWELREKVA